jgi:threonine/homoserine/homoserine lactone efflux protein
LVTIGLCTGLLVHTAAVAIGLAALFATSAVAYNLLKVAGAIYLLYLAWQALRAGASQSFDKEGPGLSRRDLYLRGVIMNITNPKVAIFFMAFLPQFADPELGSLELQLTILGVVFIFAALCSFSMIAWLSGHLGSWMRRSDRAQSILNRIAALVFVTLAARLLVSER